MPSQTQKYQTQWTAQFYAAAELTRRGCQVALTLGNAPQADLLVISPKGVSYRVDVKGQRAHNFWLVQRHVPQPDLYYILVWVPAVLSEAPQFYILSSAEMVAGMDELKNKALAHGKAWPGIGEGLNWGQGKPYHSKWGSLPD